MRLVVTTLVGHHGRRLDRDAHRTGPPLPPPKSRLIAASTRSCASRRRGRRRSWDPSTRTCVSLTAVALALHFQGTPRTYALAAKECAVHHRLSDNPCSTGVCGIGLRTAVGLPVAAARAGEQPGGRAASRWRRPCYRSCGASSRRGRDDGGPGREGESNFLPRWRRGSGRTSRRCRSRTGRDRSSCRLRKADVADVGIEQHGAESPVALNDPVDGVALRLQHVVEAVFRPASDCGRGACRTCRRPGRACRATPGAGSTPARGGGAGRPSRAPDRPTRSGHCGTGSVDSSR